MSDRAKVAFLAATRSAIPHIDYLALYRAKVLAQSGNTVDVKPDDPRLPLMPGIPLRHGQPGTALTVAPGCYILIGWMGGDPSQPYAALWEGGETVLSLTLGGGSAVDYVAKGTTRFGLEDAMLQTLGAQLSAAALDPVLLALCPAAAAALAAAGLVVTNFATAANLPLNNHYLSKIVKVA